MRLRFKLAGGGILTASVMLLRGMFARDDASVVAGGGLPTVSKATSVVQLAPAWAAVEVPAPTVQVQPALPPNPPTALPVAMTAPSRMLVGETSDVIVAIGANTGVGEIAFIVQFDPNVLQVRGGTEGEWTTAGNARFLAEVSSKEDRVQVRSTIVGRPTAAAAGSVALVQFQAVAPGATSVMVSDVSVTDAAGRALPFAISPSNVPVLVESLPPALPSSTRGYGPSPPIETGMDPAADGD